MIEPSDDHAHPAGGEPAWSESTYFNFHDPSSGLAGFSRIGYRPNEGTVDGTLFLFLPGGGAVAVLERAATRTVADDAQVGGIAHKRGFDLTRWKLGCDAKGVGVASAESLDIVSGATRAGSVVEVEAQLDFTACMPPFGTSGRRQRTAAAAASAAAVAAGHFEQACRVRGEVWVGDATFVVDGLGVRDRSWGPRDWSVPWGWRWFSMPFSEEFAIGVHAVMFPGREVQAGWVWRDGHLVKATGFTLDTSYEDRRHRALTLEVTDAEDRRYTITGEVSSVIPLRIGDTRINEGLTRFRCGDRETAGIAEYLDNT